MNVRKYLVVSAGAAALAIARSAVAIDAPGPVVDPEWLNHHLDEVTVLQIAGSKRAYGMAPKYETVEGKKEVSVVAGHVPGAAWVDWGAVRVEGELDGKKVSKIIPPRADFETFIQSLGVDQDDMVVIVPAGLSPHDLTHATRLYWQMKYYGHDDMALLDGGLANWLASGYEAKTGQPGRIEAGDWKATDQREEILAHYADVKEAVDDPGSMQLVDARPVNQYVGVFAKAPEVAGHLPGAVNVAPSLLVRADGAAANLLSPASYESIFDFQGVDVDEPMITYCNSGNLASGFWFVASEILGADAALYDASMKEYSQYLDEGATTVNPAKVY
jgi:thiosulfate/3-mercaptopyruvate sulfurtransferase